MKRTLILPNHGHQTGFRQLAELWEEAGYVRLERKNTPFCWLDAEGEILLYDYDRIEDYSPPENSYKVCLCGNPKPTIPRSYSWTFWGRHPKAIKRESYYQSIVDRHRDTIFLGKVENPQQHAERYGRFDEPWADYVDLFVCPIMMGDRTTYPFNQQEYLTLISHTKFGLCLPGYGKKCNREIELMSRGTIPIFTLGCDWESYHEPMKVGTHCLYCEAPSELPGLISGLEREDLMHLSTQALCWYTRNCTVESSWNVTLRVLEGAGYV